MYFRGTVRGLHLGHEGKKEAQGDSRALGLRRKKDYNYRERKEAKQPMVGLVWLLYQRDQLQENNFKRAR